MNNNRIRTRRQDDLYFAFLDRRVNNRRADLKKITHKAKVARRQFIATITAVTICYMILIITASWPAK